MNDVLETFSLNYFLASLLLPPVALLFTAWIGGRLLKKNRKRGRWLLGASLLALLILSLPLVAFSLFSGLEIPPLNTADARSAQAVVILAGGRSRGAPDWGGDTVNAFTLTRVRYGAHVARTTGLPVLVSGGLGTREREPEAILMERVLKTEYGIGPRWIEKDSRNTAENAEFSARMLRAAGVRRVLLVTHSYHFARAQPQFERSGIEIVPAPTGFMGLREFEWLHLVPQADALRLSHVALREWLALTRDRVMGRI